MFGTECEDAHTASSDWQAIIVLLVRVQHAQGNCQLPFTVRYDGIGQRAAGRILTVICQDVLVKFRDRSSHLVIELLELCLTHVFCSTAKVKQDLHIQLLILLFYFEGVRQPLTVTFILFDCTV